MSDAQRSKLRLTSSLPPAAATNAASSSAIAPGAGHPLTAPSTPMNASCVPPPLYYVSQIHSAASGPLPPYSAAALDAIYNNSTRLIRNAGSPFSSAAPPPLPAAGTTYMTDTDTNRSTRLLLQSVIGKPGGGVMTGIAPWHWGAGDGGGGDGNHHSTSTTTGYSDSTASTLSTPTTTSSSAAATVFEPPTDLLGQSIVSLLKRSREEEEEEEEEGDEDSSSTSTTKDATTTAVIPRTAANATRGSTGPHHKKRGPARLVEVIPQSRLLYSDSVLGLTVMAPGAVVAATDSGGPVGSDAQPR